MQTPSDRAVVIGGGMAGLLAAFVASEMFEEVIIIERDPMPPPDGYARRGTPQARHAHALLARGQQILEELFPGFTHGCMDSGAPVGEVLTDCRMYLGGHRLLPTPSDLTVISASRTFLEDQVRQRLEPIEHVQWVGGADVVGFSVADDRMTGVRVLRRSDGSADERLDADLVIDASGRTSHASAWLTGAGYSAPVDETVPIDVSYATRRYKMNRTQLGGDIAIVTAPTPSHPRAGVLAILEDGVGMLTLGGVHGDRPPRDPSGFDAFAQALAFSDIAESIDGADPIDDPVPFRFPATRWRRFDRLDRMPKGFVPVGDAVVSLNPIYGQGMTVAALQVMELRRLLRTSSALDPRQLQQAISATIRPAWDMALGADLALPGAPRSPSRTQQLMARYVTRLQAGACTDPVLSEGFASVSGLVAPPTTLFRPSVIRRVAGARPCEDHPIRS